MENFKEVVVEAIDNHIANDDLVRDFFDKGGKMTFVVDNSGTTIKERPGRSRAGRG